MAWYDFHYDNGTLTCHGTSLADIAAEVGTPFYAYSWPMMEAAWREYDEAFGDRPHLVCYTLKVNSNMTLLRRFAALGAGADLVTGGELYRALKAGFDPGKTTFSGPGKTRAEIEDAVDADILALNVESVQEFERVEAVAKQKGKRAGVAVRLNPDIDARTHQKITTGMRDNKFGLPTDQALDLARRAHESPHIEFRGLESHIGSSLQDIKPLVDSLRKHLEVVEELEAQSIPVRQVSIGGGLGIRYRDENPPAPAELVRQIVKVLGDKGITLILEPGRSIAGNAGAFVTEVQYTKEGYEKEFLIVDAGMNDLARPMLYDAYHHMLPVRENHGQPRMYEVVGPICETTDTFARGRELPAMQPGDLLALMSAGAYGFVMASNYNTRPRPAEVLIDAEGWQVVRRRETCEDLIEPEELDS